MQLGKKQLAIIGVSIILIIITIIFLNNSQTTTQSFSFSDFKMNKSIFLNEETRIETYTFYTENPIIAYLIVPKTIATDISQLTISGDYSTTIIESDPILLIKQNEYTPGIKKLIIETQTGNKEHTTILLPINLIDHETFNESEKQQLTETIKQFNYMENNYFKIEEVKKIIEEFAQGTQDTKQEFQEKENQNKIFLAETDRAKNNIINSISTIIENTNSETNQNFTKKESIFETLMFILDQKAIQEEPINLQESENNILVELGPKSNNLIPEEINLFISEENLADSITLILDNANNTQQLIPILSTNSNEITKYVKVEIKDFNKNQKELIILVDLNKNTTNNLNEPKIDLSKNTINDFNKLKLNTIELTLNYSFEKRTNHKINIIFGKCEKSIGLKLRTIGWQIDSNKIIENCDNNKFLSDLNTLDTNNSGRIQTDTNVQKDSNNFDEELIETLINKFFENNSILSNLPFYTITQDKNISLKNCENGCIIQTNSKEIINLINEDINQKDNTLQAPYSQIKSITLNFNKSFEKKTFEYTDNINLGYKCSSPCAWIASNSVEIKRFENISIAFIKQTTLTNLKIQGDYNKELVKNFEFVDYTSTTNFQLPNNEAMKYVEELKKQKKIILTIYPFESSQKIKIFIPQELKELETIMKTKKAPFLLKDGTTNPNKSGWCSAYATRFAKKYFGLNYVKADAWELAKVNNVIYREKFSVIPRKGGLTKQQFIGFAENEKIISPGDIIGVYTTSGSNRPYRLYTHVLVYLGKMNEEHLFVENYLGPRIITLDEFLKIHTIVDVIKPKN
ncbi:MAG TPA: hypothetical protein PKK60_02720 [archaeon]|nr:hypothetical protein [archaeon]